MSFRSFLSFLLDFLLVLQFHSFRDPKCIISASSQGNETSSPPLLHSSLVSTPSLYFLTSCFLIEYFEPAKIMLTITACMCRGVSQVTFLLEGLKEGCGEIALGSTRKHLRSLAFANCYMRDQMKHINKN